MKIEKMQQDNYTSTNNENNEQLFVKFHMANSITRNIKYQECMVCGF
jgi:hypothetical protein